MTTKRPVGRPPSGLPKRVRRNLNIERDADFDANLADAQRRIAEVRGLPVGSISQTEAVKLAVRFYAEVITINELPALKHEYEGLDSVIQKSGK